LKGIVNCAKNCAGAGIVCFATVSSSSNCFTNLKCSTNGCSFEDFIFPTRNVSSIIAASPWNGSPVFVSTCPTPSNPHIKSRCHVALLNSPSVITWYPISFNLPTSSVIASSSTFFNSSYPIAPSSNFLLASFNFSGRKKLPTWSYLNGVSNLLIYFSSKFIMIFCDSYYKLKFCHLYNT